MRRPDDWGKLQMFPTSFSFHAICLTINAEAGEVVGDIYNNEYAVVKKDVTKFQRKS